MGRKKRRGVKSSTGGPWKDDSPRYRINLRKSGRGHRRKKKTENRIGRKNL